MCLSIPGQVIAITECAPSGDALKGHVAFGGITKEGITLLFTPDVRAGQYVNVHTGVALAIIGEEEAAEMLTALQMSIDIDETQAGDSRYSSNRRL